MDKREKRRNQKTEEIQVSTVPIIKVEKATFEFDRCQTCNSEKEVSKVTLGSDNFGTRQTTSLKLCHKCSFDLSRKMNEYHTRDK